MLTAARGLPRTASHVPVHTVALPYPWYVCSDSGHEADWFVASPRCLLRPEACLAQRVILVTALMPALHGQ